MLACGRLILSGRPPAALLLASLLSLALHVAVIAGAGWALPEDEVPPMPLEARLLQTPAAIPENPGALPGPVRPAAPQSANRKTPPLAPVNPEAPLARLADDAPPAPRQEPLPAAASAPQPESGTPLAQAPGEGLMPPVPTLGGSQGELAPAPTRPFGEWATDGCVTFALFAYGGERGSAEHCWQHDDQRYRATLKGEASVPFYTFHLNQESIGRVVAGMLVSDVFREDRNGKRFETMFEPMEGRVRQTRNGNPRDVATSGAALDMLALMHFMGRQLDVVDPFDMFVVSMGGSVSRVTVVQRPLAPLELPGGNVVAQQYHAEARGGELKIDVWIGRSVRNAPVRLRIDDKGTVFDLKAAQLVLDGQKLLLRPEPEPPLPSEAN